MAIKIKAVKRRNPQDVEAPEKFYATSVNDGHVDFKKLAKQIAGQCTVRVADCQAVLAALEENIITQLRDGKIVHLGDVGTLRVSLSAEGREALEEVSHQDVKKAKLLFRPGKSLSQSLKTLEYQKAS